MLVEVQFNGGHNIVGESVEVITHSKWAHVSIFMLGGLLEAIAPVSKVTENLNKYDNVDHEIIKVDLPNYDAAVEEAKSLVGIPYGLFTDCISGAVHDLIGTHSEGNGEVTVNCSELVTRVLRAGGLNVLSDVSPDCITPQDLYEVLLPIKL